MVARSGDEAQPPRRSLILVATIIGSSITFVDGTVVNIALPTIAHDLDAGLSAQQWVALSYSLAVASLYIVSGALGDRYGRWSLFVVGVAGFAAASALAGIAPNVELLIAGRVLQGVASPAPSKGPEAAPAPPSLVVGYKVYRSTTPSVSETRLRTSASSSCGR